MWRSIHLETDITTCSHIAELKHFGSVTHVNHTHFAAMQADTSEKHSHLVVEIQTLFISKQSGRSGLGSVTFLPTKYAHLHLELIIHIEL